MPTGWQRLIQRAAATRPASAVLARILHLIDTPLLRVSSGRHSLTHWLTAVPVMIVTTRGARTGRPRSTPLMVLHEGRRIVLIASSLGQPHYPGWYHNLRHYPYAWVEIEGQLRRCQAQEAMGQERDRYWARATQIYCGFPAYARRASGRTIPVIVLTPEEGETTGP